MNDATKTHNELFSASGEEADVLARLNTGRSAVGLAPRSDELWRWRACAPDGFELGVARDKRGEPVAVIAAVRHAVQLEGSTVPWLEVVDLWNDFERGAGLARTRALLELAREFASVHGGPAPEQANVMYGLPTRRAHRIGLARFKQEILRSENVLAVAPSSVVWNPRGVEVEEVERFDEELEPLMARFGVTRPALLVRDAERLNWRYAEHPERNYRIALARKQGEFVGYAVLRVGEYAGRTGGVLVDWIVSPDDDDTAFELLIWARQHSAEHDLLLVNLQDKSPEFGRFQAYGFRVHGTDEYLVFRGFQKPYIMSWLFGNWYTTLGDTERG